MQSEEWGDPAGIDRDGARRYGLFQLASSLHAPGWRNSLSLAFPASDVAGLEGNDITPACVGLLGVAGTLPFAYTEAVLRADGGAARAFLDLLSASAIDMFCAAWRAARPEHTALPALPGRRGPLRARALGERLALSLGVPVAVEQFVGRWEVLPASQASALGGRNACCGSGALLGERLWRLDGAVRVVVGPLDAGAAQAFLPGGAGAQALAQRWSALAGSRGGGAELRAEACILLRPGAAQGASLGAGPRLGYDALLLAGRSAGLRDDLRYRLC
ncbi:type VI secretion system baseplate subunit TssG [Pseudoduganella sp.]|uniref:type VI secretion system baseplate subunit TssG n=1 Tax=Pseudoduganella sp. TaxID=1880898 RepID=UPI0035AF4E4B